jgi:hypothetical protein
MLEIESYYIMRIVWFLTLCHSKWGEVQANWEDDHQRCEYDYVI